MHYPRISDYPSAKIHLACDRCGLRARFDKAALLAAGGDRDLIDFRREVARRKGCQKVDKSGADVFDRCGIVYPDLAKLMP